MPKTLRGSKRLITGVGLAYQANSRVPYDFASPKMSVIRFLLEITGTLTISGVSVPGTIHSDGPANLVKDIEATWDGKTWKKGSGPAFFRMHQKLDRVPGVNDGLVGAGAGVYNFKCVIPLLAENPRSKNRTDTFIDGRRFDRVQVNVTYGDATSLVINNTSTLALSNMVTNLFVIETEPVVPVGGKAHWFKEVEKPFLGLVTGSANLQLPVTRGEVIQAVQVRTVDGLDLSDAIVQTLSLRANDGEETPINQLSWDALQQLGGQEYEVDDQPVGYAHIDTAEEGIPLTTGLGSHGNVISADLLVAMTQGAGATSLTAHVASIAPVPL